MVQIIEDNRPATQRQTWSTKMNVESPLHCPHDLTKATEFRDDLPTLLGRVAVTEQDQGARKKGDKNGAVKTVAMDKTRLARIQKATPLVQLFENAVAENVVRPTNLEKFEINSLYPWLHGVCALFLKVTYLILIYNYLVTDKLSGTKQM